MILSFAIKSCCVTLEVPGINKELFEPYLDHNLSIISDLEYFVHYECKGDMIVKMPRRKKKKKRSIPIYCFKGTCEVIGFQKTLVSDDVYRDRILRILPSREISKQCITKLLKDLVLCKLGDGSISVEDITKIALLTDNSPEVVSGLFDDLKCVNTRTITSLFSGLQCVGCALDNFFALTV
jgi:hypothetical protein